MPCIGGRLPVLVCKVLIVTPHLLLLRGGLGGLAGGLLQGRALLLASGGDGRKAGREGETAKKTHDVDHNPGSD